MSYLNPYLTSSHPNHAEIDRHAQEWLESRMKGKEHWNTVRDLMAFLGMAEFMGKHHGRDPQTGFITGPGPKDFDLEALYQAAIHAHPKTRKKVLARYYGKKPDSKLPEQPESVRETIEKTIRGKGSSTDRAEPETVRQSINRARQQAGR
jgi:hypothetical protein